MNHRHILPLAFLSPAALMLATSLTPLALAEEIVVGAGQTERGGVILAPGDALTNNGSIRDAGAGEPAVQLSAPGEVVFIVNSVTGVITTADGAGIGVDGSIGEVTNRGRIEATRIGVGADGTIGTFRNSGTIVSLNSQAVGTSGGFGTFVNEAGGALVGRTRGVGTDGGFDRLENHGSISAETGDAATASGSVGILINTGAIASRGQSGIGISGAVGTFDNSGTIEGAEWQAVRLGRGVDRFINQQTGIIRNTDAGAGDGHGVGFDTDLADGGAVGAFANHGLIKGDLGSGDSWGVGFFDNGGGGAPNAFSNGTFLNTGTIEGAGGVLARGGFNDFSNSGTISGLERGAIDSWGRIEVFSNTGLIEGGRANAVYLGTGVGQFTNGAAGVIRNENNAGSHGNGVAINIAIEGAGPVGSFQNEGTIAADPNSSDGIGVGFFSDGQPAYQVGSFRNSGSISGRGNGVDFDGGVDLFVNSGAITSQRSAGVRVNGAVGRFENSGSIASSERRGVNFEQRVERFENSGRIVSYQNGVSFDSGFITANNSGTIVSTAPSGEIGVRIDEAGGTFVNSGAIRGATGVVYILEGPGPNTFINSGVVEGRRGMAIDFAGDQDGGDDVLILRTGSQLLGDVEFGAGTDSLDLSDFRGNALIRAFGLENLEPGDNLIFMDGPDDFGVVEPTGITAAAPVMALDTTTQIRSVIANQLSLESGRRRDASKVMGYAPVGQSVASAAISGAEAPPMENNHWISLIGGGSADDGPVPIGNVFGGVVAGSHAQFGTGKLGVLGGVTAGRADVNEGGQVITATTGILGVYGSTAVGVVELDFSVLGGVGSNRSEREVMTPGGVDAAMGEFGSWFLSPSAGVAVPVLSTDAGNMKVTGRLSYVGGSAGGYTETESALALRVGERSISLLDARFGLAGDVQAGTTAHGVVTVSGKGGVFVQSHLGDASTPVTLFGQTQNAMAPDSTEWGLYAGGGMAADIGNDFSLTAGLDGQVRFDGMISATARVGIAGSF
jgi:hypothetical protein